MISTETEKIQGKSKQERLLDYDFSINKISEQDENLWTKMGQLRARTYVDRKGFLPADVLDENGSEFDEYDDYSDHFVAVDGNNEVIGTIRIIHRPDDGQLPCEKIFETNVSDGKCEVSRIMVDEKISMDIQPYVTLSLLRAAIKAAPSDEPEAYAIIELSMYRYLNDVIGIKLKTVAESRFIEEFNTENLLVSLQPHLATAQINERDKLRRPIFKERLLAPFFEHNATQRGLGKVALNALNIPSPEQFDRNLGFINKAEHQKLQTSMVSIAGAGGDGGELAVTLAQLGVGKFRIADPEIFEINNLNRQAGATYDTLGQNKAKVISDVIKSINPYAEIEIFTDGVTPENIDSFVRGADLVIDETEYTHPELGVMIARMARRYNIPDLMTLNVGFGSYTTSFSPNGTTFEKYMGLDPDASLKDIANAEIPVSRWAPHIPSYTDMNSFKNVAEQNVPTPSVSAGVKMGVAVASMQAISHLLKEVSPQRAKDIFYAPVGRSVDAIDGSKTIRFPELHFCFSALVASIRTKLGKNTTAGY